MQVKNVKCAAIGLGGRGSSMLAEFVSIPGIEVVAVCDKYEDRAKNGVKIVEEKAGNTPDMYLNYKELLERKDISAVICCTTWITHSKIAVDAMRAVKTWLLKSAAPHLLKNAGNWFVHRKKRANSA